MIVMPANNSKWQVHYWQGLYGGMGHLHSIGRSFKPFPHIPYALDNGRFPCWANGKKWIEEDYLSLLDCASAAENKPIWALVPDVVGERAATLDEWGLWIDEIKNRGFKPAIAVQDGMTSSDIPQDAEVIFVGGTTDWKRQTIEYWCKEFKRVHVGRINTYKWLIYCWQCGAESCDGTGWFRGDQQQIEGLKNFLNEQKNGTLNDYKQTKLFE